MVRVVSLFAAIGRRLPLRVNRAIGRFLGALAFTILRSDRRKAMANVAIAFPDWTSIQRRQTIRAMFAHLGMTLAEVMWLRNLDAEMLARTTVIEGADATLQLIRDGRGVIAFTGHCGNWEWVARTVALLGMKLSALQRERDEPEMNQFILDLRTNGGIKTIDRGSATSAREMIGALRKGEMLAFLLDQNIRADSVKVPFFGKPALTPIGPAKLAIRAEVPVVCIFIARGDDGKQYVRFTDIIETKRDDDPVALTARITAEIEEQIRRVPAQWVWMHDRWRERPKWDVTP
ncbi:MAG TPA: lysophospholipid acyltransferase family protein [Thermoanaerobaculia bacterium]|nr:lysophospholipid acyltransferase family protein [Thermoanaerobaculia bacterium]